VRLSGALDTKAIKALLRRLTQMARQSQEKIVVDLSGLAFCSERAFHRLSIQKERLSKSLGDRLSFESLKSLAESVGKASFGDYGTTSEAPRL
jgi:anti-anti-sigma regulatory factor